MKYLCLVYHDERQLQTLSASEYNALVDATVAYDEQLRRSGHILASNTLAFAQAATTIRVRGGKVMITDGSFAETREQLAGYVLIEARDLDEAIRLAAQMPPACLGSIEVRPVAEGCPW